MIEPADARRRGSFLYINKENKELKLMASNTLEKHLKTNQKAFESWKRKVAA